MRVIRSFILLRGIFFFLIRTNKQNFLAVCNKISPTKRKINSFFSLVFQKVPFSSLYFLFQQNPIFILHCQHESLLQRLARFRGQSHHAQSSVIDTRGGYARKDHVVVYVNCELHSLIYVLTFNFKEQNVAKTKIKVDLTTSTK